MKIGIISDTHDDFEATNHAIDIFENNSVEAVIKLWEAASKIDPDLNKD